jgi:hypothetical protein
MSLSPVDQATPVAVLRKLQHRLLDGAVTEVLGDTLVWVPRQGELPDLNPNSDKTYQASIAGVFHKREVRQSLHGPVTEHRWLHIGSLDDLDDLYGPRLAPLTNQQRFDLMAGWAMDAAVSQVLRPRSRSLSPR